jgi:hypothetical protein
VRAWKNYYRYTRVGQPTSGAASVRPSITRAIAGRFEIGAAVAYGAPSGERDLGHERPSASAARSSGRGSAFSRYVQTRFAYYYLYLHGTDCNRGAGDLTRVLRTSHHVGGSYYKKYDDAASVLDGSCHTADSEPQAHRRAEEHDGFPAMQSVSCAISIFGIRW